MTLGGSMLNIKIERGDSFVIGEGFIWLSQESPDHPDDGDIYLDLQEMAPVKRRRIQRLKGRMETLASQLTELARK
jgi:hypothetical protein